MELSKNTPPVDMAQLLARAASLAGRTLQEMAEQIGWTLPADLQREKGVVGQLLEAVLGASAGSKAEPDFPHLGIELKTLPIDSQGKPLESTYVCLAPIRGEPGLTWETSWVRRKLSCVLWVPILAERNIPLAERMIATPFLWRPTAADDHLLKQDWEELMELIALGKHDEIKGAHGQILQLRPKAANSDVRVEGFGADGAPSQVPPKGFYLKAHFTQALLQRHFA